MGNNQEFFQRAVSNRGERLEVLTALRFFLAIWVVFYHFFGVSFQDTPSIVTKMVGAGASAVGFFYMLSGFVLFVNYHQKSEISKTKFFRARFSRVYPVYLLGLLWMVYFSAPSPQLWDQAFAVRFFSQLLALQSWYPPEACQLNCPGWSISNEVFFYALFPLLLPLFRKPLSCPCLLLVGTACWLVTLIAPTLALHLGGSVPLLQWATYNPLSNLALFVLGLVLGNLHRSVPGIWNGPVASSLGVGAIAIAIPIAILVLQGQVANGLLYINLGALAPTPR